ncbi:MAG: protein-L-isoaspartate(D-aspartate) O-methyltransferase [Burkholderiaceae bacterium]
MSLLKKRSINHLRSEMVQHQIADRGISSHLVLQAMLAVAREAFLPQSQKEFAYQDRPLPIAQGQTMSQPYIVALMTEALELQGGESVLEIGTGSGYAAAVLSQIANQVYSVERIAQLASQAAATLAELGYHNVSVRHGDGTVGWLEHAPYDAIVVTAGGPVVPEALKAQLKIGGRLVIPVGPDLHLQELRRVVRVSDLHYNSETLAGVRFVPLLGAQGWAILNP